MERTELMLLPTQYVNKPWGRDDLPAVFAGAAGRRIGEVWFDAPGDTLPLLIKWLFTSERLSVQVHPNDAQARAAGHVRGKEECWFIVAAEPGATIGIGTKRSLSGDELAEASRSGAIEAMIDWRPAVPGDFYFIPAGTVHAIGAGVRLVEIQQNSDVTYRLYDYGRPRSLHLDDGVAVAQAKPYADPRCGNWISSGRRDLMSCDHFSIHRLTEENAGTFVGTGPFWVTPVLGVAEVNGTAVAVGACFHGGGGGVRSFRGAPALLASAR
jgi:mannose-6-phosphate isomerase